MPASSSLLKTSYVVSLWLVPSLSLSLAQAFCFLELFAHTCLPLTPGLLVLAVSPPHGLGLPSSPVLPSDRAATTLWLFLRLRSLPATQFVPFPFAARRRVLSSAPMFVPRFSGAPSAVRSLRGCRGVTPPTLSLSLTLTS